MNTAIMGIYCSSRPTARHSLAHAKLPTNLSTGIVDNISCPPQASVSGVFFRNFRRSLHAQARKAAAGLTVFFGCAARPGAKADRFGVKQIPPHCRLDRKSTRLNSSHV